MRDNDENSSVTFQESVAIYLNTIFARHSSNNYIIKLCANVSTTILKQNASKESFYGK